MPQWFLSLWIAARDILGPTTFNVASGILSYIGYAASKAMVSLDISGASAAGRKEESIDIQTARFAGYGSLCARDVVIGANSGSKGLGAGGNIIIGTQGYAAGNRSGNGAILRDWALHNGRSVLVGSDVLLDMPASLARSTITGDVAIGSNIFGISSDVVMVGSTLAQNGQVVGNSVLLGSSVSVQSNAAGNAVLATPIGVGKNISMDLPSLPAGKYVTVVAFGGQLNMQADGVDSVNLGLFGVNAELNCTGATPRIAAGMGIVRFAAASTDTSHQAGVDVFAGSTTNSSLVLLGSDFGTNINFADQGANAAYRFAFGDQGKVLDAGVGTNVVIPDNCSTYILTGSGTRAITFPANPYDGQFLTLTLGTAHTAVTVAGNAGKTVVDGTMTTAAGSAKKWVFHKTGVGTGVWYRHA